MSDPFNDYCYLFNYLSMRTWAEARADCVNQGGDLVSITDPFEQAFIQGLTFHFVTPTDACLEPFCSVLTKSFVVMSISAFEGKIV